MNQLIIKTEGKPSKCEVCHQSDVFDATTQVCGRCQDLASVPSASKPVETFSSEDRVSFFRRLNLQFEDSLNNQIVLEEKGKRQKDFFSCLTIILNLVFLGSLAFSCGKWNLKMGLFFEVLAIIFFIELAITWLLKSRIPFIFRGFIEGTIGCLVIPFLLICLLFIIGLFLSVYDWLV
ncbi:MAG TPA: hypothetical protein PLS70_02905 [Acidobacteriota bacterium]|nr:hypothetical protein [Acidobacteriota bacterium]